MLRLCLFACAVLYVGLTILSERSVANADVPADQGAQGQPGVPRLPDGTPDSIVTADGRRLPIAAVIKPGEATATTGAVPLVVTPRMAAVPPPAPPQASGPASPLAEVTGTSVNLRAGPSTADAVLVALQQGDRVEVIGATDDGWAQIRTVADGREGFMSSRFLTLLD
jgi:hypothetical protein